MTNETKPPALPLAGLRVLDLSRALAGPFCATILADTHDAVLAILEKRTMAEALARADLVSSEAGLFGHDVFAGAFI
jgi:crotonobetainyl-CoA:carnitine CoA-transferase CaiB-like acyl-CoA transferase